MIYNMYFFVPMGFPVQAHMKIIKEAATAITRVRGGRCGRSRQQTNKQTDEQANKHTKQTCKAPKLNQTQTHVHVHICRYAY